jgi:type III restriction enzyme
MKQVVIENPILNSPFEEPRRHFKFTENQDLTCLHRTTSVTHHYQRMSCDRHVRL